MERVVEGVIWLPLSAMFCIAIYFTQIFGLEEFQTVQSSLMIILLFNPV